VTRRVDRGVAIAAATLIFPWQGHKLFDRRDRIR